MYIYIQKIDGNYKHILRKNTTLQVQHNFVFVDTESKTIQIDKDTQKLIFYLGFAYFWNRIEKTLKPFYFKYVSGFWNYLECQFSKENNELILYAHNTEFDFKMLNGFLELQKRNWKLETFYIKGKIFMLIFKKDNYTLYIYDTMNYVQKSLKELGKSVRLKKLGISFDKCTDKELIVYCKRDVRILYKIIKKLIELLELFELTKIKATSGSLAFNCFRHKFIKPDYKNPLSNNNIIIHNWKKVVKLERESYHGGITECFNLKPNLDCYKLDINSMYSKIMYDNRFPIRLLLYNHESSHSNKELMDLYNKIKYKPLRTLIAKVSVIIPKENAYIMNNFGLGKTSFTYTNNKPIKITLCLPELLFLERNNGKICKIHEIAIYRTKKIFKEYIKFFHNKRVEYKKTNDLIFVEFCKKFMNLLYGKFAQKKIEYKTLKYNDKFISKNRYVIECMIQKRKLEVQNDKLFYVISYLGTLNNKYELYIINHELIRLKKLEQNSFDSFVAISSLIASYSRMLLIKYLKIAKRENVFYCDTDSLFVNEIGYNNLKSMNLIDKFELGKLKIEGIGKCSIYAPKFYDFNNNRKVKGIKKDSVLIKENNKKAIYETTVWKKFKSDLKSGFINEQIIITTTKEIYKKYDKGKIINNIVYPYSIQEINKLNKHYNRDNQINGNVYNIMRLKFKKLIILMANKLDIKQNKLKLIEIKEFYESIKISEKEFKEIMLKVYNNYYSQNIHSYTSKFNNFYNFGYLDILNFKISQEKKRIKLLNKNPKLQQKAIKKYYSKENINMRFITIRKMLDSQYYESISNFDITDMINSYPKWKNYDIVNELISLYESGNLLDSDIELDEIEKREYKEFELMREYYKTKE